MKLTLSSFETSVQYGDYAMKIYPRELASEPGTADNDIGGSKSWTGDILEKFEVQHQTTIPTQDSPGEGMREDSTFEFPDHAVLVVREERGWAHRDPDSDDLRILIHIGPDAEDSTIAAAEAAARKLAATSFEGITEAVEVDEDPNWLSADAPLVVIRHRSTH